MSGAFQFSGGISKRVFLLIGWDMCVLLCAVSACPAQAHSGIQRARDAGGMRKKHQERAPGRSPGVVGVGIALASAQRGDAQHQK